MRYDTVFLDVDGTLLWVDLDVEGYVEDMAPYSSNGGLTAEEASRPLWDNLRRHISENIKYRTEEELAQFKLANAERTARALGIDAPSGLLVEVSERRTSFIPYPETERVMGELGAMGCRLYAVSNWDILLWEVLDDLGWTGLFDGVAVSAKVGVEKPEKRIFEEALRLSGREDRRSRVVHVGDNPVSDVEGATGCGLDAVLVDRKGGRKAPGAVAVIPNLDALPGLVGG